MIGRFALALAASVSVLPMTAHAQDANTSDEIVVTANKREELLRDVPQSVTAITEQTLERTQANNFGDLVGRIPGMSLSGDQPGNQRVTLRGLNTEGVASTIGTYIDETPFGSSTSLVNGGVLAIDLDPSDISRIEVLRGPQGTLYGASSLGGLIKFVTADPGADLEFRVRGTAETTEDGDESYGLRGIANIPLGDRAGVRISAWNRSQGGFIDDPTRGASDVNSVDVNGARVKFLLHATDNLTFRLSAMQQEINSDAPSSVDYLPDPLTPLNGDLEQERLFSQGNDVTYRIFNGTVDWDLGWATLTSSSSYNELDQDVYLDATVAFGISSHLLSVLSQDKFTQEFRLASPASDRFEWLLGAYYSEERGSLFQQVYLGPPPGIFSGLDIGLDSEYEEHAVFGSATYYFSPQFDISAGVRAASNEQSVNQFGTAAPPNTEDSEDDVVTYSVSPRWRPNDNTMVYARIASGYRPGGPNVLGTFGTLPTSFGPDTAVNYELGVKTDLFSDMLRLDVAVFRIDWEDIQLLTSDGIVNGNINGGSAQSQGVEWTATFRPSQGLTVLWAGAYTDAELTANTDPPLPAPQVTGGLSGDPLPNSPLWTSSVDVDYEWAVFGDARAYVGGTWRYIGERYSGFSLGLLADIGDTQVELPAYDVIDLRGGVDFDTWALELFAKNVGDERDPLTFGGYGSVPPGPINGEASVLRPRTIGVSVSARF